LRPPRCPCCCRGNHDEEQPDADAAATLKDQTTRWLGTDAADRAANVSAARVEAGIVVEEASREVRGTSSACESHQGPRSATHECVVREYEPERKRDK
jgi:hypothetical protein